MTLWIIILLSVLFIFISISTVLYFVQDKIIFHAEKLPQSYKFSFQSEFEEINLKSADGNILNGVLFKVNESKGVLFFLHNHSGNVEHWNRSAMYLNHLNYDVLITDYRGYGKSTGKYNEQFMYDDTKLWYDYLKSNYNEKSITVYGRGIGATFATFIASINNPRQLILESPLYDLYHTAKYLYPYLPFKKIISKYKFDTASHIKKVKCNIHIFHGKKDELVNYKNSVMLYQLSKENTDLSLISDGNHYNLINHKVFLDRIKEILRE